MVAIITKIGLGKIAKATIDKPLIIEKFAVGDGNGNPINPNEEMTSLINEKYRDLINDKYANQQNTVFEVILKEEAPIKEGFYIRELGLFDQDGDLIVITDVPVQYRPGKNNKNIVTELLFNIYIQIHNSEVLKLNINQQLFSTVEQVNRVKSDLEIEINKQFKWINNFRNNLIASSVGIDKWFNIDGRYKDQDLVKIGIKTYALMDSSNILKIKDFPILFKNLNVPDLGDGTFKMPNFYDGTLRQIKKGSKRELGSYEEDAMQKVYGSVDCITYVDLSKPRKVVETSGMVKESLKTIYKDATRHGGSINWWKESTVSFDNSNICRVAEETRMKNTAGQWYVLAQLDM